MSGLEAFLARLYTDAALRRRFLEDPDGEAARAGLSVEDAASMTAVDRVQLEAAAAGFEAKRRSARESSARERIGPFSRLRRAILPKTRK